MVTLNTMDGETVCSLNRQVHSRLINLFTERSKTDVIDIITPRSAASVSLK